MTVAVCVMSNPMPPLSATPGFTVIIPTFDRVHVLPRAIDSVLRQSFADFELLVIDDGSSDGTEECVAGYRDGRIRYIRHERNRGQNTALNTGLAQARGAFVSFLDSDDEWDPAMLETVLERFRLDDELGWVYTAYRVKEASGLVRAPVSATLEGWIYAQALEQAHVSPPTTLSVRRSCFDVVGLFDCDVVVGQDDVMCLTLARTFKAGRVDSVLATIHADGGSRLTDDPARTAAGYYALYEKFSADILAHCGRATLARHYTHAGRLFASAGNRRMAFTAHFKSLASGRSAAAIPRMVFSLVPRSWQQRVRAIRQRR